MEMRLFEHISSRHSVYSYRRCGQYDYVHSYSYQCTNGIGFSYHRHSIFYLVS